MNLPLGQFLSEEALEYPNNILVISCIAVSIGVYSTLDLQPWEASFSQHYLVVD